MDPWYFAVFVVVLIVLDQLLAQHIYKHRVRRNKRKFLAHARIKFPEAQITLSTVDTSDLLVLEHICKELDELPDEWNEDFAYTKIVR